MRNLLEKYLPLREGEGGGSGGGQGGAGGDQNAGGAGSGAGGAAAADAGGSGAAAAAAAAAAGTGQPYRPEGLPDNLFGAKDSETIDKLWQSAKGYRDRDAQRGVPEQVEAYATIDADTLIGDLKLDPSVKPHLAGLDKDPIMAEVGRFALERGLSAQDVQGIVGVAYAAATKAGVFEAFVDPAKERESLLPETAKALPKADQDKAIDKRLQENEDFIKLLSQPGADGKARLDAKVADHALLMLMDTAAGNQFIEFVRSELTGGGRAQPFNGNGGQGGNDQRAALQARLNAPEMQPGHPNFRREAYDQLMADYQRVVGE